MGLSEFITAVEAENSALENRLTRCDAFLETVNNVLAVNIKEAELKVITENGTVEDFVTLKEAAEESAGHKIVKTIGAIVESIRTFFKNIAAKVAEFFDSDKTKKAIAATKKASSNNPRIARLKIKVKNAKAINKAFDEEESILNRLLAKAKSGNASEKDIAEARKASDARKKKIAIATAITVGVGEAIAIAELCRRNINGHSVPKAVADIYSDEEWDKLPKESKDAIIESIKMRAKLEKERGMAWTNIIKDNIESICNAIRGKKDIGPSDEVKDADDFDADESAFNTDAELDNLVNEVLTESDDAFDAHAAFDELLATIN